MELGGAVIAFSGGVDSSLLAKVAFDILGDKVLAVTADSFIYSSRNLKEAKEIAKKIGIQHLTVETGEVKDRRFLGNNRNRCYWCKKKLFFLLRQIAVRWKFLYILDGTNYDDISDVRPGLKANREYKVISPLYECKFTKVDIKKLAKSLKLSCWNKAQETCLCSRIPFGEKMTKEKINRIDKTETVLRRFFGNELIIRARDHGDILRIEIENRGWTKLNNSDINSMVKMVRRLGYKYVTFDCEGYVVSGKRFSS